MAQSIQRIIVRRALDGEHPTTPQQIIDWLEETAEGWNADRGGQCTLWVAVELIVVAHFAVLVLVLNKGKGRDKWPTKS